jgi:protein ImuA
MDIVTAHSDLGSPVMSRWSSGSPRNETEMVAALRRRLGLFSFREEAAAVGPAVSGSSVPSLSVRPGSIVEWLTAAPGAGVFASALQVRPPARLAHGVIAIVDSAGECYAPALSGWGIRPGQMLFVRPSSRRETCWAVEQCLRCPGVSATWAWVEQRLPSQVHRRWQLAAEVGGGTGIIFRPETARREPVWADLRLLVAPRPGGQGETRRVRIDVLYCRGGVGGTAQVWEIDHAEGVVRLVSEMAPPAAVEREARA